MLIKERPLESAARDEGDQIRDVTVSSGKYEQCLSLVSNYSFANMNGPETCRTQCFQSFDSISAGPWVTCLIQFCCSLTPEGAGQK